MRTPRIGAYVLTSLATRVTKQMYLLRKRHINDMTFLQTRVSINVIFQTKRFVLKEYVFRRTMFETWISDFLASSLGHFIDVKTDQLKVSLWKGILYFPRISTLLSRSHN